MREFHYLADAKKYAINLVEYCAHRWPGVSKNQSLLKARWAVGSATAMARLVGA